MSKIRECIVGKNHRYSYCPNCAKDKDKPTWMFIYCSERCKSIDETVAAYTMGDITETEAKERLEKIDTDIEYRDLDLKDTVNKILGKKSEEKKETVSARSIKKNSEL